MRLSLRFIVPLAFVLAALAYAVVPLVDSLTLKWFVRDLEIRSQLVANTIEAPLVDLLREESKTKIVNYFHRLIQDERLYAIGFCDQNDRLLYKTQTYPETIPCDGTAALKGNQTAVMPLFKGAVHLSAVDIKNNDHVLGRLILVHDMSWVHRRSRDRRGDLARHGLSGALELEGMGHRRTIDAPRRRTPQASEQSPPRP
jgi:hypothetical protein